MTGSRSFHWLSLVVLGACSSSPEGMAKGPAQRPPITGTSSVSGASGAGVAGRPAIGGSSAAPAIVPTTPPGSTTPPATTKPPAAGSGGAGVSGGAAGTLPAAGSGGGHAVGGAPATSGTGTFIREKDPTEDSLKSMGEFTVKSYTELDGLVGGTAYGDAAIGGDGSELYYPTGTMPPYAAMVIVPGFTAQRSDIAPWAAFLASHGIVSLAIDTNSTSDQPDVRSMALLDALESLKKENMRDGSPIKGQIDTTHMGVMGWSMGGGGTWITADGHPELKVAVSLCGWIIGAPGSMTKVPSLQLAVRDDELAAGMSQPIYAAIPDSTPKMLVEWQSGGHWTNNTPTNQDKQVGRYGLVWVKIFLEGDDRYRQFLKVMPQASSDFKSNQM